MLATQREQQVEAIKGLEETLKYLTNDKLDEFYSAKLAAKKRLMKYYLDTLSDASIKEYGCEELVETARSMVF